MSEALTETLPNKAGSLFNTLFKKKGGSNTKSTPSQTTQLLSSLIAGETLPKEAIPEITKLLEIKENRESAAKFVESLVSNAFVQPITKEGLTKLWKTMLQKAAPSYDWPNLARLIIATQLIEKKVASMGKAHRLDVVEGYKGHFIFKTSSFWSGSMTYMIQN